jgi:phosphatidylserine/phosphatidylglycerophosphate/cardiolipin synthase-like enzyme
LGSKDTLVDNNYVLARSICESAAWDADLVRRAIDGNVVPEIEQRCSYLGISSIGRLDILRLALDLCMVVAHHRMSAIRVVASRPTLVPGSTRVWGLGQEWLQLIRMAEHSVVIIAPSLDAPAVTNLKDALSAAYLHDVRLTVLYGALGKVERIRSALSILRSTCPNGELLEWPSNEGFLHVKAICVDDRNLYIGSANLTEFGWEKNVELGLTLSGAEAAPLAQYCAGLIEIARAKRLVIDHSCTVGVVT